MTSQAQIDRDTQDDTETEAAFERATETGDWSEFETHKSTGDWSVFEARQRALFPTLPAHIQAMLIRTQRARVRNGAEWCPTVPKPAGE